MGGLDRFLRAQETTWAGALAELRAGAKRSHWMWFVFPQLSGLGQSSTARHYAIADLAEARAYLAHPVLGARLEEATRTLLAHAEKDPATILGTVDALKLRSCLTLFEAAGGPPILSQALDSFYAGERDPMTLGMLNG